MIRLAEPQDISQLFLLSLGFIEESGYGLTPNPEKIVKLIRSFMNDADKILLVIEDKEIVGMLGASVTESYFSNDRIAQELVWFVDPKYRGHRDSIKLIDAYERWAKMSKCSVIQLSTILDLVEGKVEKFYNRRGYKRVESAFIKELQL
jgi:GNAT superfamily N-acetyltransferase